MYYNNKNKNRNYKKNGNNKCERLFNCQRQLALVFFAHNKANHDL